MAREVGLNRTALTISPDDLPARAKSLLDKGYRVALIAGHEDIGGIGLHAVYLFTAADPDRRVELAVPVPRDKPTVHLAVNVPAPGAANPARVS